MLILDRTKRSFTNIYRISWMSTHTAITELFVQRVFGIRARVIRIKRINELLNLIRIFFPCTNLKNSYGPNEGRLQVAAYLIKIMYIT